MALGTIGLSTYRWNSSWKSIFLIILYPALSFWLFWWQVYFVLLVFQDRYGTFNHDFLAPETDAIVFGWGGLCFGVGLLLWFFYSWNHHASVIRGLSLAHPVTSAEEPRLYAILESVAISQGLPTPELEIMETHARNSFVCDDGNTARIFVTRGLLENLQSDEIEAVFAHEIAHIMNGDTRLLSFSIAFCDLYSYIGRIANSKKHQRFSTTQDYEDMANAAAIFFHPIIFAIFGPLWVGYILTSLIRVFLFINRELDADAAAVQISKNPDALMRALIRINRRARLPFANHDIKFLCIDNPLGGFFATHPRLSMRLQALKEITNTPIPEIEPAEAAPLHKRFQDNHLLKRVFKPKDPNAPKPFNAPWKN